MVILIAIAILSAGIALWFMEPAWFVYTETRTFRAISIGFMVGGPVPFVMAVLLPYFVRGPKPAETEKIWLTAENGLPISNHTDKTGEQR